MQNTYMPTKLDYIAIKIQNQQGKKKCICLMCVLTKLQAEVRMSLQETNIGKEHSVADLPQNADGQRYTGKCSV